MCSEIPPRETWELLRAKRSSKYVFKYTHTIIWNIIFCEKKVFLKCLVVVLLALCFYNFALFDLLSFYMKNYSSVSCVQQKYWHRILHTHVALSSETFIAFPIRSLNQYKHLNISVLLLYYLHFRYPLQFGTAAAAALTTKWNNKKKIHIDGKYNQTIFYAWFILFSLSLEIHIEQYTIFLTRSMWIVNMLSLTC